MSILLQAVKLRSHHTSHHDKRYTGNFLFYYSLLGLGNLTRFVFSSRAGQFLGLKSVPQRYRYCLKTFFDLRIHGVAMPMFCASKVHQNSSTPSMV